MATSKIGYNSKKAPAIDTSGDPQKLADSLVGLAQYVEEELSTLSSSLKELLRLRVSTVAPTKPRQGMIVFADGAHWNPGSGEGAYVYKSDNAWHLLG